MSVRAYRDISRRKSKQIHVGPVPIGGDAPITVQTMTNTITGDAKATIDQIRRIEEAGCDIVRVSCPDEEATAALKMSPTFAFGRALRMPRASASCMVSMSVDVADTYGTPTRF